MKLLYDREIAYIDNKISEIIDFLKVSNLYDNTLIVITSDHGEHFGEYGLWSHVASLHKEVLHVPLIIKYPKGIEYVKEVSQYTQSVDIYPTVMNIANIENDKSKLVSGVNLRYDRVKGNKYREIIFAEWEGRMPYFILDKMKSANMKYSLEWIKERRVMVQDRQYKLIKKDDGSEEWYDISNCEKKLEDIMSISDQAKQLRDELKRKEKDRVHSNKSTDYSINDDIAKNLKALGYM